MAAGVANRQDRIRHQGCVRMAGRGVAKEIVKRPCKTLIECRVQGPPATPGQVHPASRGEFLAHPIPIPPAHPISVDGCAQLQCRVTSNKPRIDISPVLSLGQTASNMPAWVGPLKFFRREFRMRQAQARLSRQNTTCAVFFTLIPRHPVEQDVGTQDSSMLRRLHAINNMRGSGYGGLVTPSRPR